jgi:outer membrane immunogenic protein
MKKLLLAAALCGLSTTAMAADLPSRKGPPVFAPPPLAYSWTGFYIGGQAGYEFGRDQASEVGTTGNIVAYDVGEPQGFVGGGHIGYNFSTQSLPGVGNVLGAGGVIGVEGDVNGSDYKGTAIFTGAVPLTQHGHTDIDGSVRGRLGIAFNRVLVYVTGGAAFGDLREDYTIGGLPFQTFGHTRVGYTVGGGVEYALTNNWSVRAEYRYTDYGRFVDFNAPALFNTSHREDNMRVQAGVSYKFDMFAPPAPVVAKY